MDSCTSAFCNGGSEPRILKLRILLDESFSNTKGIAETKRGHNR